MTSARGARASFAVQHHRVAKKEAALSPRGQARKIKKHGPKILAAGIGFLLIVSVKWFVIGYLLGKKSEQ